MLLAWMRYEKKVIDIELVAQESEKLRHKKYPVQGIFGRKSEKNDGKGRFLGIVNSYHSLGEYLHSIQG
jgi:hypothetical protein